MNYFILFFYLFFLITCQNQSKNKAHSIDPVVEKTQSIKQSSDISKEAFLALFKDSEDLKRLLTEQMTVETEIESKAGQLYDLLVSDQASLASCSDLKTLIKMDYDSLKKLLLDMGKQRFAEEIKTMGLDEMIKWYQSRVVSADLVEEIAKKNEFSSNNHDQLIVMLEVPTILIGALGAYYTMRDLRKWGDYVRDAKKIEIGEGDEKKTVELIRHKSGFLIKPEDNGKALDEITDFYLDDPITKKIILNKDKKPQVFAKDTLEKLGITYSSYRKRTGLRDASGGIPLFVRDKDTGAIVGELKLDSSFYEGLNIRKPGLLKENIRTSLAKARKNRSKFDPAAASGIEKHFGTPGRWGIFFASLAAATAGLIVTTDTLLGLSEGTAEAKQDPSCESLASFKELTLAISQLKSHYMDIKTQVLLLL